MEQLEGVWRAVEHGGLVLAPGERPSPARAHLRATGRSRSVPPVGRHPCARRFHRIQAPGDRGARPGNRLERPRHAPTSSFEKQMSSRRASASTCGAGKHCAKPRPCITTREARFGRSSSVPARSPSSSQATTLPTSLRSILRRNMALAPSFARRSNGARRPRLPCCYRAWTRSGALLSQLLAAHHGVTGGAGIVPW